MQDGVAECLRLCRRDASMKRDQVEWWCRPIGDGSEDCRAGDDDRMGWVHDTWQAGGMVAAEHNVCASTGHGQESSLRLVPQPHRGGERRAQWHSASALAAAVAMEPRPAAMAVASAWASAVHSGAGLEANAAASAWL